MNHNYYQQTKLMLQILPIVAEESCFALKGGTAINFFIRDLPRYSVDIDLTYIKFDERDEALEQLILFDPQILFTTSSYCFQHPGFKKK